MLPMKSRNNPIASNGYPKNNAAFEMVPASFALFKFIIARYKTHIEYTEISGTKEA